jgi:DNA-binding transcriptional regulator YiaG
MSVQEIDLIRKDKLKRSRFVKRFYILLEDLTEINFTIQFDENFPKELLPVWAIIPEETNNKPEADNPPQEQRMPDGFFDAWLQGVVIITSPAPIEGELAQFETSKAEMAKQFARSNSNQSASPDPAGQTITVDAEVVEENASLPQELTGAMVRKLRQEIGLSQMDVAIAMGMSQSWVRNIENKLQDKPLKPLYAEQLRKILRLSPK